MKHTIILLLFSCALWGQQVDENDVVIPANTLNHQEIAPAIEDCCEKMPEYIGGWGKIYDFFKANLNRSNIVDTVGKVFIRFIVNKNGAVENPTILKGLSKSTNDECLRVVKLLKFTPALQNKKPISVPFNLPINIAPNFNPLKKSKKH